MEEHRDMERDMTYKEVLSWLKEIFSEVLDVGMYEIHPGLKVTGEIGDMSVNINSFDYVRLIVEIEERFNIVIDFDVIFETVEDIIQYILAAIQK